MKSFNAEEARRYLEKARKSKHLNGRIDSCYLLIKHACVNRLDSVTYYCSIYADRMYIRHALVYDGFSVVDNSEADTLTISW